MFIYSDFKERKCSVQSDRRAEKARKAKTMPWSERDARMWQTVFPNMAKWLPDDEAEQLCFAFVQEMERLRQAA